MCNASKTTLAVVCVWVLTSLDLQTRTVSGHGILLDPPGRSSIWRDKRFPRGTVPVNHHDTQLFCGGYTVQNKHNHGLCGVCGDAFNLPHPRPHEAGGIYARGIIVRHYQQGDVINVTVMMTANHLGYYVFKLCPNDDVTREASQLCLDRHRLKVVLRSHYHGSQMYSDRFAVDSHLYGNHQVSLQLPRDVTCSQCVLQWTYVTGHNWGCDGDGACGIGHGPQEHFVNCADIGIRATGNPNKNDNSLTVPTQEVPAVTSQTKTVTLRTKVTWPRRGCRSAGAYSGQARVDVWCRVQCAVGYCPETHCVCA